MKKISNYNRKGFTLVEVMVATVILAVGIVAIFEIYLMSLDAINLFNDRLKAQLFINEKIAQLQNDFNSPLETFVTLNDAGIVKFGNKIFNWEVLLESKDLRQGLYLVKVRMSWFVGSKQYSVQRFTLIKKYFSNILIVDFLIKKYKFNCA
ncbi:MAG: prepilin-type N-terminal cleavage/methylation domain-containing protein [Candidatus Omnitrophota bacterium]